MIQKWIKFYREKKHRYLIKILEKYKKNDDETWSSITTNQGSVEHLDFLTKEEKERLGDYDDIQATNSIIINSITGAPR